MNMMKIKDMFIGPIKSKDSCKIFNIINWIMVVLIALIIILLSLIMVTDFNFFKKRYFSERGGYLLFATISACIQVYIVRVLHGMCLKTLV